MINCELLAPAGSPETLKIAAECGADAVYLGGNAFNARASANNFTDSELAEAVDFCHLRKVKVYVTVNILIGDREFDELKEFIIKIYEAGVDAVIVQDIGVAMYIKNIVPQMRLHASTQMTVYDVEGARFLKSLGFERVVLARELSIDRIREISAKADIETEIFVHGAMCVCYSGQCLMSSMIGGRSGNRGKCAQPCRLQYKFNDKSGFLMSLKDMCLIRHLDEINKSGVISLKIEGRMKGPDYVGTVVSMYRKYLDCDDNVSEADYKALESIFFRGGFSDGYFTGKKGREMFCHNKPDNPYLKQQQTNIKTSNYKKTKLFLYLKAHIGKKLLLDAIDEFGNVAQFSSDNVLECANNTTMTKEKINDKLNKLGDPVFVLENLECDFDSNVYVPVSTLNEARRCVTKILAQKIVYSYKNAYVKNGFVSKIDKKNNIKGFDFAVSVCTKEQLASIRKTDCKKIYVPLELSDFSNDDEIIVLPRISPDDLEHQLKVLKNPEVLITNIGQIPVAQKCNKIIHIDFTMNVFNRYSCKFFSDINAKSITLSSELTLKQITNLTPYSECEAVIYGKLPLMITENCLIKSSDKCTKGGYIYDRTNERFMIKCLPNCRNEIYNSKPIIMSDKIDDIELSGLRYGRLNFTDESPEECLRVYEAYKKHSKLNIDFTRGKFYKGV